VNRGERAQAQALAYFLKRRRILVLLDELRDEVVHLPLTSSDCHALILGEKKAKKQALSC